MSEELQEARQRAKEAQEALGLVLDKIQERASPGDET